MALELTVSMACLESKRNPGIMYKLVATRCPGCKRHAVGMAMVDVTIPEGKKAKYGLCYIMDGEVLPLKRQ